MDTGKIAIGITAAAFAGFGTASLVKPDILRKVGIKATNANARTEVRAMYGGLEIGFGVFFALAAIKPSWRQPALAAIVCAIGALGATRIASAAADGAEPMMYAFAVPEVTAATLAAVALATDQRG